MSFQLRSVFDVQRRFFPISAILAMAMIVPASGCRGGSGLPAPPSEEYQQTVSLFHSAVAQIQIGEERGARYRLQQATTIAPGEPALWYNLGLLELRNDDPDSADVYLERARRLAPDDSRIFYLSGILESQRGQTNAAEAYLRRALEIEPDNLKALFALEQRLMSSEHTPKGSEPGELADRILVIQPGNLAALIERIRITAMSRDEARTHDFTARLAERTADWPLDVTEPLRELQSLAGDTAMSNMYDALARLENALKRYPVYRKDRAALQTPAYRIAEPMTRFLRLSYSSSGPSPADTSLAFSQQPLEMPPGSWDWVGAPILADNGYPVFVVADRQRVYVDPGFEMAFPGDGSMVSPSAHGVVPVDFNYDFRIDLVLAGAGGVRFHRQEDDGSFVDVTATLGLSPAVINRAFFGAWAVDHDLDGDMDLIVALSNGPPALLRNNGDGTFAAASIFEHVLALRDLVWLDADADGDPDPVVLDRSGQLHFYRNEGAGGFRAEDRPVQTDRALAIAMADLDYDGSMNLLVLLDDGRLQSFNPDYATPGWEAEDVIDCSRLLPGGGENGYARILAADMDNSGTLDLVVSMDFRSGVWLRDADGEPIHVPPDEEVRTFDAIDLVGVGRLDLVAVTAVGVPVQMMNMARKEYLSTTLRPRAAESHGDRRINSFGIGGIVSLRSGLHFQTRPITGPVVHFGLGEQTVVDVVRTVWPNGAAQTRFDIESDQAILAREGLNSSCPWVFAYDGEEMAFVADFIMRSPLGFRINASETAEVASTRDRIKIRRDQLVEKDDLYEVHISAELWETLYIDHVSLSTVDHPVQTEFFVNEFYSMPALPLDIRVMEVPRPIARARDADGRDVTNILSRRDGRYLGGFEISAHLSQAEDHSVEIDLGSGVPVSGPVYLVASGWLRATDSAVNIAIAQEQNPEEADLWLEVLDRSGEWMRVRTDLGLPYGMFKTAVIDLTGVFRNSDARRLRLRTNQEIYWDQITWSTARPEVDVIEKRLEAAEADLRFRGFSTVTASGRSQPEVPVYDELASKGPVWRTLNGYYTRYGDVRPLLGSVDDRYVIMNAGDELVLRFPASEPPPSGWVRDFILNGDGWTKDGSPNTLFSRTVLPLPNHRDPNYSAPPGRLEEDPVYQRHPDDWQRYHTRYVSSDDFDGALRGDR